jgi:hypothetical protein
MPEPWHSQALRASDAILTTPSPPKKESQRNNISPLPHPPRSVHFSGLEIHTTHSPQKSVAILTLWEKSVLMC